MDKSSQDTVFTIKSKIYGHGRGWCFTLNDLEAAGTPEAVRQAVSRLQKAGFVRRIGWGLYDYPRSHEKLGQLPPDIDQVIKAVARKDQVQLLPSGAYAANLLGLSEQVPGKIVHLTNGPSRKVKVGKTELIFKSATPKSLAAAGTLAGTVIQALRYFGKNHVDNAVKSKLRKKLKKEDLASLKKHSKHSPVWIRKIIEEIVEGAA